MTDSGLGIPQMLESKPSAKIRFQLLGPPALFAGQTDDIRVSGQKSLALLIYLAMHAGRPVKREVLADLLWGDRVETQARQSLRQTVLMLRRDLGPIYSAALAADGQSILLAVEASDVDALQFAAQATSPDLAQRLQCLDVPWAPFLDSFSVSAEPFDEWLIAERHRLDAIATRVFSDLAKHFDAAGDGERAIAALERLVAIDPGEEDRHRRLLQLEARYRGADAALARAKLLAAMLQRELDAEPEPATRALLEQIRQSAPIALINSRAPEAAPDPEPAIALGHTAPKPAGPTPQRRRPARWAAVALVALLAGGGLALMSRQPQRAAVPEQPSNADVSQDPWQPPRLPSGLASPPGTRALVTIAVMPFENHGEPSEQADMIAEMISDDLTNVLAHSHALRVISRRTMKTYRGQRVSAAAIGAELGISYLLEGSVSARNGMLRVNADLIDTRTQLLVWSVRSERSGADRYAIQDEILAGLGRELHLEIERLEADPSSPESDIRTLIFKGWAAINDGRRSGGKAMGQAEGYFKKALERDPGNVQALRGLATFHAVMAANGFTADEEHHLSSAEVLLERLKEQRQDMFPHGAMGIVHRLRGRYEEALRSAELGIASNPSGVLYYSQMSRALVRLGRHQEAIEHILYAIRLSPRDPGLANWLSVAGASYLAQGNVEHATHYLERAQSIHPLQPRTAQTLIAAHALAGKMDEARQRLAQLQAAYPHLTTDSLIERYRRGKGPKSDGMRRVLGLQQP